MLTKTLEDNTATPRIGEAIRWAVMILKQDDSIEVLSQSYATQAEATREAERCAGWMQLVRVGTAPLSVDLTKLVIVTPRKAVRTTANEPQLRDLAGVAE